MIDAHAHPPTDHLPSHTMFVSCCTVSDWTPWLARQRPNLRVGIGTHPWFAEDEHLSIPMMRELLISNPQAFVGEVGLDRSKKHRKSYAKQQVLFAQQLALAEELRRPVCAHLVRSSQAGHALLKQYDIPSLYIHGFLGSVEDARSYPRAFFGFNARNVNHPKGIRLLKELRTSQILLESDGASDPVTLRQTLEAISIIRGAKQYDMEQIISENAQNWIGQS